MRISDWSSDVCSSDLMHDLQEILKHVTGMAAVSLTPMAGAQGEFAGVAMIRAYHKARNDLARTEILVPDAAHGTNPATAAMLGCTVREIPPNKDGDVDADARSEERRVGKGGGSTGVNR